MIGTQRKAAGPEAGRSATRSEPGNKPFQLWVRTSEAPCGIVIAKRSSPRFVRPGANNTGSPGRLAVPSARLPWRRS